MTHSAINWLGQKYLGLALTGLASALLFTAPALCIATQPQSETKPVLSNTTSVTDAATKENQSTICASNNVPNIDGLIAGLLDDSYDVRTSSQSKLQTLGWAAADNLLVARRCSQQLEQRQVIDRLLQQLPSFHVVVKTLCPDCPSSVLQRTIDFQHKSFAEKAAIVRFLSQHEDRIHCRSILCIIARLESDSLIRDFAVTEFIEELFPIHAVDAYRPNTNGIIDQIPDRPFSDSESSSNYIAKEITFQVNQWISGRFCLQSDPELQYCLADQSAPAKTSANSRPGPLTDQADFIRQCLHSINSGESITDQPVLGSISAQTRDAIDRPIFATSPQRFELQNEVLVRMARWCVIQTRHQPQHKQRYQQLIDCLYCLGCDTECFRSNAAIFCELAVLMEQPNWIQQWHQAASKNSVNNPAPILALSEAAFELHEPEAAGLWLYQEFLGGRSRFSALQFAVLAKELGYLRCHRFLLSELAARPLDGSTATATAKLLNAEAYAAECDYQNAATQLQWLLTELHADSSLETKVEKRLPQGLNEVRVRLQYFLAQDALDHWDHAAALRHLSIGHSLNPLDTNILSLAWKINGTGSPQPTDFQWDPNQERITFLQGLTTDHSQTTGSSIPKAWPLPVAILPFPNQIASKNVALKISIRSSDTTAMDDSLPEIQTLAGSNVFLPIQISLLHGKHLQQQTKLALQHFEIEIRDMQFALNGAGNPAQRLQQVRELSASLNRWAYLATSSDHQLQLAYQRSQQATKLASHSSAYFDTLALCCENTGRLAEAIQATRIAMSLSPHDPSYRTRLATLQNYAQSEYR